jgi:hypothetical protein
LENENSYFQAEFGDFRNGESDEAEKNRMQNLIMCDLKKWAWIEFSGENHGHFKFGLRIKVSGEALEEWGSVLWVWLVCVIESVYRDWVCGMIVDGDDQTDPKKSKPAT